MKGSILAHGPKSWRIVVDAPRQPGGRRRQITRVHHGTRKSAEYALAALVVEVQAYPSGPDLKVGEMLRQWLELAELTPASKATSRSFIDAYLIPHLGELRCSELTIHAIDRTYRELLARGGRGDKPLKPSTVHRAHGILTRACSQAVKWGMMANNPAREATPPRQQRAKHRAPAADDVRAVIDQARASDPETATFLALAAATGARRGELCGLRWSDLDAETLHVRRSVSVVGRDVHIKSTKTGRERSVHLGPATLALLEQHRAGSPYTGPADYVFASPDRGPWLPSTVTHRLVRFRKAAGVKFRLHDLRHYAATTAIDAGIPITAVAARLGHARPSTTTDMYGTPSTEEDRRAGAVLDGILEG